MALPAGQHRRKTHQEHYFSWLAILEEPPVLLELWLDRFQWGMVSKEFIDQLTF